MCCRSIATAAKTVYRKTTGQLQQFQLPGAALRPGVRVPRVRAHLLRAGDGERRAGDGPALTASGTLTRPPRCVAVQRSLAPWLRLILTPGVRLASSASCWLPSARPEGSTPPGIRRLRRWSAAPQRTLLEHDATPAVEGRLEWTQPGNQPLTLGDRSLSAGAARNPRSRRCVVREWGDRRCCRRRWRWSGPQRDAPGRGQRRVLSPRHRCRRPGWHRQRPGAGDRRAAHRAGWPGRAPRWPVIGTGADRIYPARNAAPPGRSPRPVPSSASFLGIGPLAHNFRAATGSSPAGPGRCWWSRRR